MNVPTGWRKLGMSCHSQEFPGEIVGRYVLLHEQWRLAVDCKRWN